MAEPVKRVTIQPILLAVPVSETAAARTTVPIVETIPITKAMATALRARALEVYP